VWHEDGQLVPPFKNKAGDNRACELKGSICNDLPTVTAGGEQGTRLRRDVKKRSVTSHQRLDSVEFDQKIEQKNQEYKQK
jgi:hypothetical protein